MLQTVTCFFANLRQALPESDQKLYDRLIEQKQAIRDDDSKCILCNKTKEDHMEVEACPVCTLPTFKSWLVSSVCNTNPACTAYCLSCFQMNISSQFARRASNFTCMCSYEHYVREELLKEYLTEDQYKSLQRYRVAEQINHDPDLIWCPTFDCDTAIKRVHGQTRATCQKCNTNACFKCQKPWHQGRCAREGSAQLCGYFCLRDVRKCPKCKTRI